MEPDEASPVILNIMLPQVVKVALNGHASVLVSDIFVYVFAQHLATWIVYGLSSYVIRMIFDRKNVSAIPSQPI